MTVSEVTLQSRDARRAAAESPFIAMSVAGRTAVAAGLVGFFLLASALAVWTSPFEASALVILALGGSIALRLVPLVFYRREYGWFHPLIFGNLLLLLTFPRALPLYVWGLPTHSALPGWTGEALTRLVAFDLVLGTVGLVAYYVGFFALPAPRPVRFRVSRLGAPGVRASALVAFSVLVFAAYMQSQGGILNHLVSWQLGRREAMAGEYYWSVVIGLGAIACLLWLSIDRRAATNPLFWVCALAALAIRFLTTGSRSSVLFLIGIGLIIWMLKRRRIATARVLVGGILCVLLLGALGTARRTLQRTGGTLDWSLVTDLPLTFQASVEEMRSRAGSDATSFAVLARVPEEVPLLYGESYWSLLTRPIPRALWEGKPVTVEARAGATFHGVSHGRPIGTTAEAYWNFGWIGVVLVYLLFGVFHRWLAASYRVNAGVPGVPALYVLLLFYAMPSSPGIFQALLMGISALIVLRLMARVRVGLGDPGQSASMP